MTPEALAAIQARADAMVGKTWGRVSVLALVGDRDALLEALREGEADNARLREALSSVYLHHGQVAPDGCRDCETRINAALAEPSADGDLVSSHESGINPMTGGL